jgi:TolB-like protein
MIRITACIAAVVVAAVTSAIAEELKPSDPETEYRAQTALDLNAIAVLPIEVLTSDPFVPQLSVDAYNELIKRLEAVNRFNVVEKGRVEPFAGTDLSPKEIARELGVNNIVQGHIELRPPYYVLQLQFISVQDDRSRRGTHALIGVTDPTIKCAINPETALPDGISDVAASVEQWLFPIAEPTWEEQAAIGQSVFLDTSLSDKERMLGLRDLRNARGRASMIGVKGRIVPRGEGIADKPQMYNGSIVVAAAQIGLESEDESIRHSIWFTMAGVGDLYLVGPLLQSLKNDDDVWVRAQAATTLADFIDEPGVRSGLDYARVNDAEEMVRKAANLSILSDAEKQDYWKAIVLSPSDSDQARMRAIFSLQKNFRDAEPLDEEIMQRGIALGTRSSDPRVRSGVWFSLSRNGDPIVVEPMLQLLSEDPDERVRERVLMVLSMRFIEEPGVREAIEGAQTNDSSPLVRKAAEERLRRASRKPVK